MPLVTGGTKRCGIELSGAVGCPNVLEGLGSPELLERMLTKASHGMVPVDILVAQDHPAIRQHHAPRANAATADPRCGCHWGGTSILALTGIMGTRRDADRSASPKPTVVELVQLMHIIAGLGHVRERNRLDTAVLLADGGKPVETL